MFRFILVLATVAGTNEETDTLKSAREARDTQAKGKGTAKVAKRWRPGIVDYLQRLDRNGDNQIARNEFPEKAGEWFSKLVIHLDSNFDNVIGREELESLRKTYEAIRPSEPSPSPVSKSNQAAPPETDRIFRELDRNADSKLDEHEAPPRMRERFDRVDANQDGTISIEELRKAHQNSKRFRYGWEASRETSARELFDRQDSNADGRISKEEAKAVLAEEFQELDSNQDGKLDPQEVENGLTKKAGTGSGRG